MPKYNKQQLEQLWVQAGGDPKLAHTMGAIGLAESSGNSSETNSIGACGLWQIHPYEAGCLNPAINAQKAVRKYHEQGLGAWESYTNGSYQKYLGGKGGGNIFEKLGAAVNPVPSLEKTGEFLVDVSPFEKFGNKVGEFTGNPLQPFEQIAAVFKAFNEAMEFLTSGAGWLRILKVIGGGVVIIIALNELTKSPGEVGPLRTAANIPAKTMTKGINKAVR